MKKIFIATMAVFALGSAAFFAKPQSSATKANANALPNEVYYYNTMDYAGLNGKFGDLFVANGIGAIKGDTSTASGWVDTYTCTPNLVQEAGATLTTDYALSFDVAWPYELDWSKLAVEVSFGSSKIVGCFQRSTGGEFLAWLDNYNGTSKWAHVSNDGGYLTANPNLAIGTSINCKVAITSNGCVALFENNQMVINVPLATFGLVATQATDIRIFGRTLYNATETSQINIDNILLESYVDGNPNYGTKTDNGLDSFTAVPGENYKTGSGWVDNYVCHLGWNHSIQYGADLKFGTDVNFDFKSFFINGNSLATGCDSSIAIRIGYDAVNTRFFGHVVFANDIGWTDTNYFALNNEIIGNTWQSYTINYLANRLVVTIDGGVVFNKTYAEMGMVKTINDGAINFVNTGAGVIYIRNGFYKPVYETTASISSNASLKAEISTFTASLLANRKNISGIYSICDLINDPTSLAGIVTAYDNLSNEAKAVLDKTYDGANNTVGKTVRYLRNFVDAGSNTSVDANIFARENSYILPIVISLAAALILCFSLKKTKKILSRKKY